MGTKTQKIHVFCVAEITEEVRKRQPVTVLIVMGVQIQGVLDGNKRKSGVDYLNIVFKFETDVFKEAILSVIDLPKFLKRI